MPETKIKPADQDRYRKQLLEIAARYESLQRNQMPEGPVPIRAPLEAQPISLKAFVVKQHENSDIMILPFKSDKRWVYCVGCGRHMVFPHEQQNGPFEWHIGLWVRKPEDRKMMAIHILEKAHRQRPEFFVVKPCDARPVGDSRSPDWEHLHIFRRYHLRQHPDFSAETIANDLLWLVKETYNDLNALPQGV